MYRGSATTENLKRIAEDVFSKAKLQLLSPLGRAVGYIKEKHIDIKYKEAKYTFEISTKGWNELLETIRNKFTLNAAIVSIYRLNNGEEFLATEMSDFIDKEIYYIRTEIDPLPGNSSF